MKKLAGPILLAVLFPAAPALGHPFDTINYECKQLDPKRDGVKCLVRYEGSVPVLYVRFLYTRERASKRQLERMNYVVTITQRNFVALGGSAISQRFTLEGIPAERHCGPAPNRRGIACWDPERVSDLENPIPWPF